ncbi:MAG TPA: C4-type zinc ribbon domain-containing protein [Anaerolineales bacterium]|nr:C4-type zinc ribbon domain-containing protein [Anaerolineales bacterium]
MSQSFKLYRLQQIDSQIDHLHSHLREIAAALAEESTLRLAQTRLSTTQKKLAEADKNLRKAEADVQAQRIKIEQTETALYGGKVRNPKELQDLQKESAALKRYLNVLEDRQLEVMLVVEESENELLAASATHEAVLDESTQQKASLLTEQAALLKELELQESERQAATSSIIAADLRLYDQLRGQRSGVAVARVLDKTCAACGSTLSAALLSAVHSPNQISRCTTCGRILYLG